MASKNLTEKITHFRYSTKRKNRYFFSAWINKVWTGIVFEYENEDFKIIFNGEQNKHLFITTEQKKVISEECIKELKKRKLVKEGDGK